MKYGDSHTEFNELTFLCKQNMNTYITIPNQKFSEYNMDTLKLEETIYHLCLQDLEEDDAQPIPSESKLSFLSRFTGVDTYANKVLKKKRTVESDSHIDAGNLSDDLDHELGLNSSLTVM